MQILIKRAIGDLPAHGLEPVLALDDFPPERFLQVCVVLSSAAAAKGRVAEAV